MNTAGPVLFKSIDISFLMSGLIHGAESCEALNQCLRHKCHFSPLFVSYEIIEDVSREEDVIVRGRWGQGEKSERKRGRIWRQVALGVNSGSKNKLRCVSWSSSTCLGSLSSFGLGNEDMMVVRQALVLKMLCA